MLRRTFCLILVALCSTLVALCSTVVIADEVPDIPYCTVVPADALNGVVLSPDLPTPIAASIYTITVHNSANNPVPNAVVEVVFPPPTDIRVCTSAVHHGTTDALGICVITLRGGGCKVTSGTNYSVLFKANGVIIRAYHSAKSPDWNGVAGNGVVDLADLVCLRSCPIGCHDYGNDGAMHLDDVLIFAPAWSPSHHCTLAP